MLTEGIPPKTQAALELLIQNSSSVLKNHEFYLAGGTALALQIPYRYSYDLDFFTKIPFNLAQLLAILRSDLKEISEIEVSEGTLKFVYREVNASFFFYPYELMTKKIVIENGLAVASILDIALMKISAISNRGLKKDFYDLYYAAQNIGKLSTILNSFPKKYPEANEYHYTKGLVYFKDTNLDPPLNFISESVDWEEVKGYFKQNLSAYLAE